MQTNVAAAFALSCLTRLLSYNIFFFFWFRECECKMGLSLVSINVLRKLKRKSSNEQGKSSPSKTRSLFHFAKPSSASPKPSSPTDDAHQPAAPTNAPASTNSPAALMRNASRRLRFRDASADDLVNILASLQSVPTDEQTAIVTDRLTSDSALFARFVEVLVNPSSASPKSSSTPTLLSKSDESDLARSRLQLPWVVSTLLRHGDPALRDALATNPNLIRRLASIFDVKVGALDEGHASLVADVLRSLLHSHSKAVASALQSTSAIRALTRHVAVQPAADLLPRFVGTHVFTSASPGQFLAAHKRAIAALAAARVQTLLADRFVCAAADISDTNSSDGLESMEAHRMLAASSSAMAEISARAARLRLKPEDVDERADNAYASTLGLVTSSGFNDAKRYLDFFDNPAPAVSVLRSALVDCGSDPDVVLPALNMLTSVLTAARVARGAEPTVEASTITISSIPVDYAVHDTGPSPLGLALVEFVSHLADLLAYDNCSRVTPVHLSVLDLLREMIDVLDDDSAFNVLFESNCKVIFSMLALATRFATSNMLMVRVGQVITCALTKPDDIACPLIVRTDLIDFLWRFRQDTALRSALDAFLSCADVLRFDKFSTKRRRTLEALVQSLRNEPSHGDRSALNDGWGNMAMEAKDALSLMDPPQQNVSVDAASTANEDFGQELYVMAILNEVSSQGNRTPPKDDFVGNAADVKSK